MSFTNFFSGKRVLVTGHTGFKGGWLSLWLKKLGADVHGIALAPDTTPSFFELAHLNDQLAHNVQDIREFEALKTLVEEIRPEIVFHLAAQPLVRLSYEQPRETFETNVLGTVYLLEALKNIPNLKAVLCVTSDKVYENNEQETPFVETDALGGKDPYSASKSATEMVIGGYRNIFLTRDQSAVLATARGGNVIGGGDWAEDRLIPDLVRAIDSNTSLVIRNPQSVRPWQHVLCLCHGYLRLMQELVSNNNLTPKTWNFGPDRDDTVTVAKLLDVFGQSLNLPIINHSPTTEKPESNILMLSSEQAKNMLSWKPGWRLEEGVKKTAEWYKSAFNAENMMEVSDRQLEEYIAQI